MFLAMEQGRRVGMERGSGRRHTGWLNLVRDLEVHNNFQSFIILIWWFYTKIRFYLQDLAMRWLQFFNTALLFKREIKIEMNWQSTHSCTLEFIMQYTNRNNLFYKLAQVPRIYRSVIDRPVTQGNLVKDSVVMAHKSPLKSRPMSMSHVSVSTMPLIMHQAFILVSFLLVGTWKMPHLPGRLVTANMPP